MSNLIAKVIRLEGTPRGACRRPAEAPLLDVMELEVIIES